MATGTMPAGPPPVAEKSQPLDAVTIDRGISEQLKRARFHVWLADLIGVLALWLAVTLTTFIVASACEHWIAPFGIFGRTIFLSGLVGISVYFIGWKLAPLLLRRINNVFAARVIEQHDPTLKNSIVNFLYIKDETVGSNGGMQEVIVENLRRKAASDLTRVQVDAAIDRTTMFRYAYALAGVVALLGAYKVLSPKDPFVTVARVLAPWAKIAPPCRVTIVSIKPGDVELTQGEILPVEVEIEGLRQGETARVIYSTADGRLTDQSVPLSPKPGGFQFEAQLPATATDDVAQQGLQQDIVYRIEAGDAVGFDYRVKVRSVSTIDVQRVELAYPEYTGRGRETLDRTGDVRAVEGTYVTLHARANRPIRSADIEFFTPGTIADESGVRKPAAKIPLIVTATPGETGESDRKSAQVSFILMLQPDGRPKYDNYQLRFVSEDQQSSSEPVIHQLEVLPDLAPEVEIIRPDAAVTEIAVDDSATIDVRGLDPDFGLRRLTLKLLRGGKELPSVPLLDEAGGKRGPVVQSWTLKPSELGLQAGDEVRVWAVAEDNRYTPKGNSILDAKMSANPNSTRSNVKTFSIVPPQPGKEENPQNKPEESPEQQGEDNKPKKPGDKSANPKRSEDNKPKEEDDPSSAEKNESKNGDKGKSKSKGNDGSKNKPENSKTGSGNDSKSPMNKDSEDKPEENPSEGGNSESGKDDQQNSDQEKNDEQKGDNKKQPKNPNNQKKSKANQSDQKSGSGGAGGESSEEEKQSDQAGKSKEQGGGSAGENSESASDKPSGESGESGTQSGNDSKGKNSDQQGSGDDGSNDRSGASSKQSDGEAGGKKGTSGGKRSDEAGSEGGEERDEDPAGAPESDSNNQKGQGGKGKPAQRKLHPGEVIEKALEHKKEQEGSDPAQQPGEQQEKPSGNEGESGAQSDSGEGKQAEPKSDSQGGGEEGDPKGKGGAKSSSGSGGAGKEEQGKEEEGNTPDGGASKSKTGENAGKGSAPKEGNGKADKSSKGTDASGGQQPKPNDPSTEPEKDPNAPDKTEGAGDSGEAGSGNSDSSKDNSSSGAPGQKANVDTKKDPDKGGKAPKGDDPGATTQSNKQSNSKGATSGDQSGGGGEGGGQPGKQKGNDTPGSTSAGNSGNGAANQEGEGEDSDKAGTQKEAPGKTGKSSDKAGDGSGKKADESSKAPGEGGTDGDNPNTASKKMADAQSKQGKGPVTGGGAPTGGSPDNSVPPPGPQGEVPEGGEANEAYAKKATDLALQHLRDQQDNPDPDLLKRLGWTKEELRNFLDRWDAMKREAERSPEAAERLEESYKSLGIRPAGDKRRGGGTRSDNTRDLRDAGGRSDPPSSYADQFRAFRKGAKSSSGK